MSAFYRLWVASVAFCIVAASNATAWETYTNSSGTGNCSTCHGDYRSSYTSNSSKDPVSWGTDLMSGHEDKFGIGCDVCHLGKSRKVVYLASSDGAGGLAPLGCMGCHGCDQGSGNYGAGLRAKHGSTCTSSCHTDDPLPAEEIVLPPYYASPGRYEIPSSPCNLPDQLYPEAAFGSWGLDNDGDGLYDGEEDGDCAPVIATEPTTWGHIKALYN